MQRCCNRKPGAPTATATANRAKQLCPPSDVMAAKTLTINGKQVSAEEGETVLQAAADAGIEIPTLCHLEGVYDVGACRLCLVEVAGVNKLLPACTTKVTEGMDVKTD